MPERHLSLFLTLAINLLPIILHFFDKLLDICNFIDEDFIRSAMARDEREAVAKAGDRECFEAIHCFFSFEKTAHLIISLGLVNIISFYAAQVEHTQSLLRFLPVGFALIIVVVVFIGAFMLRAANGKFDLADPTAARDWKLTSIALFVVVIAYEIYLHASVVALPPVTGTHA